MSPIFRRYESAGLRWPNASRIVSGCGQPRAMPSVPLEALGSGSRSIRKELNKPISPASSGTTGRPAARCVARGC